MEPPLIDDTYLLQKQEGKGGWTFAVIAGVPYKNRFPQGHIPVRGYIDDYEIKATLLPMGNERVFLPVKAETRKRIAKGAGDEVKLLLYLDVSGIDVPEELMLCLQDEPDALAHFMKLTEAEKRYYVEWITAAKKEETRIERMAKTVNRLLEGRKFYDK